MNTPAVAVQIITFYKACPTAGEQKPCHAHLPEGKKNKLPAAALLQRAGGKLAEIDHILAGFFAGGGGDDKGLG